MPEAPATPLDPEQPITCALLWRLYTGLQLGDEIPPRLMVRALEWAAREMGRAENQIACARHVLQESQ